jgi:hypothetical protein
MTPLEEVLLTRIQNRAAQLEPQLAQRLLAAYRIIRQNLTDAELYEAIRSGVLEAELNRLLDDRRLDPAFAPLRSLIDRAVRDAAAKTAAGMPSSLQGGVFDVLNPNVIAAARALDTRVIDGLKTDIRQSVIQHAVAGLEAGVHPRTVARGLRDVLELAPNQEKAVRNFRRMLEEGDREALTRALRDRRFDSTLRRAFGADAKLPPATIEKMADAYRRRMVKFNAEIQARTAALDAQRAGQRANWGEAIDRGVVDRSALRRTWLAVGGPEGDGRNRPEHLAMHGQTVGFDEPYSNGQLVPGETDYNCRCIERFTLARAVIPVAA